jgi:hypothetical protein
VKRAPFYFAHVIVSVLIASPVLGGAPGCPGAGVVLGETKASATQGGFTGSLLDGDNFGSSVASIGDLDGDGVADMAVGARNDDDGGSNRGAVWIVFLNAENTVKAEQKISDTRGGFGGSLANGDTFGSSVASLGDLDGDGVADIAVGAPNDDNGGVSRGAVWIVFLNPNGSVKSQQKISDTQGGFGGVLDNVDAFGGSVAGLGDLDGDGTPDLAVSAHLDGDGGNARGAVWVLFLNPNGTVKAEQKISALEGGFGGALADGDGFGKSVANIGDLDGDGVTDLAVGATGDDDGGNARGAVWIVFLNANGTVKTEQKISGTAGGFGGALDDTDNFGESVAAIGDIDGDGVMDLAVGAEGDDDGGFSRGAVWILFLNANGTVKAQQKISDTQGGFGGLLDNDDDFGAGVALAGDLDGDGSPEIAIAAPQDDDGGTNRGAVWIVSLFRCVLPPTVTMQPESVLLDVGGGPATFIVGASGSTPIMYQWRKDGVDLVDGDFVSGATTPTLLIRATQEDVGIYDCVVSNSRGVITTFGAVLGVRPSCAGDADGDGDVDFADLNRLLSAFGMFCKP